MSLERIKTIVIIVLIVAVIALGTYSFLGKDGFKNTEASKQFVSDIQMLQASLSYYLGSTYSDTFGIYTKPEILAGKATGTDGNIIKIKDNDDKDLPSLIEIKTKQEKKGLEVYEIDTDAVMQLFEVDLTKYENATWYIQEDGIIKVDFKSEPDWWQKEFESFKIGK